MKALISTLELRETGYRIAQVEPDENIFAVADSMFWIACPDDVKPDSFWYDISSQRFIPVLETENTPANQPITQGAQTL